MFVGIDSVCCLLIVLFYWLLILIVLLWLYKFNFDLFSYVCLCIVYVLCCWLLRLFVYGNLWWLCSCAMVLVGCLWCLGVDWGCGFDLLFGWLCWFVSC